MEKIYDVYGIGNPLIDLMVQVEEPILEELSLNKGIMHLIDLDRRKVILDTLAKHDLKIQYTPGGSGPNTIISTGDFGLKAVLAGGISDDDFGHRFEKGVLEKGVISNLANKTLPTGSSIILVTPDAERTQNTFLGACQQFAETDVNEEKIAQSRYLYFTGYMYDTDSQKAALDKAIKIAKENGTKIVFDVADPFAVNRSKEDFLRIIKHDADFVLANHEEAKIFTGKDTLEEIIQEMISYNPRGAIKDGKNGSYIYDGDSITKIPVFLVDAVDTTGAGDIYAAGILYGLVKEYSLDRTGRIASYVAAKVVEGIGARLDFSMKDTIDTI